MISGREKYHAFLNAHMKFAFWGNFYSAPTMFSQKQRQQEEDNAGLAIAL